MVKITESMINDILYRESQKAELIKTGYCDFDRIAGGLRKGEVYLLAGCSGIGKTSFVLNLVENIGIYGEKKIAFYSADIPKCSIITRLIQLITKTPYPRGNEPVTRKAINDIINAEIYLKEICGQPIGTITMDFPEDADLVILDGLEELDEQEHVSLAILKGYAAKYNCVIIVTSRIEHDNCFSVNPKIEQRVANIICLCRENDVHPNSQLKNTLKLYVDKSSDNIRFNISLEWNPDCMKITSIDDDRPMFDELIKPIHQT